MNVTEYMNKHNLTDDMLDRIAEKYEQATFESEDSPVFDGSHLDAVGKRRITVVYDASATQKVASIAKSLGVKPSDIYRDALNQYFLSHA